MWEGKDAGGERGRMQGVRGAGRRGWEGKDAGGERGRMQGMRGAGHRG